jgi:hypothetical protein
LGPLALPNEDKNIFATEHTEGTENGWNAVYNRPVFVSLCDLGDLCGKKAFRLILVSQYKSNPFRTAGISAARERREHKEWGVFCVFEIFAFLRG